MDFYQLPTLQGDPRECSLHALLKNNIHIYIYIIFRIKREILNIFFIPRSFTENATLSFFLSPTYYIYIIYTHTDGVHTEGLIIIALEYTLKCHPRHFFIYYALVCRPFYSHRSSPRTPTTTLGSPPPRSPYSTAAAVLHHTRRIRLCT